MKLPIAVLTLIMHFNIYRGLKFKKILFKEALIGNQGFLSHLIRKKIHKACPPTFVATPSIS